MLAQAGWTSKNGILTNTQGVQLAAEFLLLQPDFERIVLPYKASLEKLGIKASVRVIDSSQYQQRQNTFDFDIIVANFPQSESPGNEQRDFWGSDAAGKDGSRNVIGIKNPAVDKLTDRIIQAKDRQSPGGDTCPRPGAALERLCGAAVVHPRSNVWHFGTCTADRTNCRHAPVRSCGCGGGSSEAAKRLSDVRG